MYPLKMMIFHGFLYVYQAGYIRNDTPTASEDTELPLHQQTLHLLAMSWRPYPRYPEWLESFESASPWNMIKTGMNRVFDHSINTTKHSRYQIVAGFKLDPIQQLNGLVFVWENLHRKPSRFPLLKIMGLSWLSCIFFPEKTNPSG